MPSFDFAAVPNGTPLPLREPDFEFAVAGAPLAKVTANGISCGYDAALKLTKLVDDIELSVDNTAQAVVVAWLMDSTGLQIGPTKRLQHGLQQIKFSLAGITRITFTSTGELSLKSISY
jgi:hypothetical protein